MNQSDIERREAAPVENKSDQSKPEEPKENSQVRTYTKWQLFYIERLRRMTDQRRRADETGAEEFELKALKRAMFSTLLDCDSVGLGDEARELLARRDGAQTA